MFRCAEPSFTMVLHTEKCESLKGGYLMSKEKQFLLLYAQGYSQRTIADTLMALRRLSIKLNLRKPIDSITVTKVRRSPAASIRESPFSSSLKTAMFRPTTSMPSKRSVPLPPGERTSSSWNQTTVQKPARCFTASWKRP